MELEGLKLRLEQHLFDLKTQQEVLLALLKLIQRCEGDEEKKSNITEGIIQLGFLNLVNQSLQPNGLHGGSNGNGGKQLKEDVRLQRKISNLVAILSFDERVRDLIRNLEGFLKVILSSMSHHLKDSEVFRNWCEVFYLLSIDTNKRYFLLDQFELITNLRFGMKEKLHRQDLRLQQIILSYLLHMCATEDVESSRPSSPLLSLASPRSPRSPRSPTSPRSSPSSSSTSSSSSSSSHQRKRSSTSPTSPRSPVSLSTSPSSPSSPSLFSSSSSSSSSFSSSSHQRQRSTTSATSSRSGHPPTPHSHLSHPPAHALPSHSFPRLSHLSHPPAHHLDNSTSNQLLKLNLLHLSLIRDGNSSSTTSNSSSPRSSSSPPSSLASPRSPSSPSPSSPLSSLSPRSSPSTISALSSVSSLSPPSSQTSSSPGFVAPSLPRSPVGPLPASLRCYSDYILLVGLSPLELVMSCHLKDLRIQQLGLGIIRHLSSDRRRHPEIVNNNFFECTRRSMVQHPKDFLIQQLACETFSSFDSWDEVLQQALKKHVDKTCLRGLLKATRAAMLYHLKEPHLQRYALSALSAFASLPIYIDYSKSWDDKVLKCIRKSMTLHQLDDQVQRNGCEFLSRCIRFRVIWHDTMLKLVQEAMACHLTDPKVQAVACSCLYWMAQENYEACLRLGFLESVKAALINNPLNEEVYLVVRTLLLNYRSYAKDHQLESLSFFTELFAHYKTAITSTQEYLLNSHLTARLSSLVTISEWRTALVATGWSDVYLKVKEEGGHYDRTLLADLVSEHILQLFEKRKPFFLNTRVKRLDFPEMLSETTSEEFINWFFTGLEKSHCSLRSLNLIDNKLSTASIERISEYLKKPFSTLRILDLSGNRIGDFGASHLASALRLNSNLKRLLLYDTSIGSPGKVALEVGLHHSTAPALRLVGIFGHALSEAQTPEARTDRKALMFFPPR